MGIRKKVGHWGGSSLGWLEVFQAGSLGCLKCQEWGEEELQSSGALRAQARHKKISMVEFFMVNSG